MLISAFTLLAAPIVQSRLRAPRVPLDCRPEVTGAMPLRLPAADDDDASPHLERADLLKEVLKRGAAPRSDVGEQHRNAAKQKIDSIRQQLDTLRLVLSGDAKPPAGQAAKLAWDLAGAVKDYVSAAGAASAAPPLPSSKLSRQPAGLLSPSNAHMRAGTPERHREDDDFKVLTRMVTTGLRSVMRQAVAKLPVGLGAGVRHETELAEVALQESEAALLTVKDTPVAAVRG